jgi:hypothetical protein
MLLMTEPIAPRNEPEVMRANGRGYVAWCNKCVRLLDKKKIYIALELAQQAHEAHGLPYEEGLSAIVRYPPDRFTWICDESGDAKQSVKVRDNQTDAVVVWPHWHG